MTSKVGASGKFGSTVVDSVAAATTRVSPPNSLRRPILIRPRVLMGSGPTNPSQRVTEALSKPQMGIHSADVYQVNGMRYRHDMNARNNRMTAECLTFKRLHSRDSRRRYDNNSLQIWMENDERKRDDNFGVFATNRKKMKFLTNQIHDFWQWWLRSNGINQCYCT